MLGQPRAVLTEKEAIEIYCFKYSLSSSDLSSNRIARKYGVSPKTIRDIWNGRTWKRSTLNSGLPFQHLQISPVDVRKPEKPSSIIDTFDIAQSSDAMRSRGFLQRPPTGNNIIDQNSSTMPSPGCVSQEQNNYSLKSSNLQISSESLLPGMIDNLEAEGPTQLCFDASRSYLSELAQYDSIPEAANESSDTTTEEYMDPFHRDWEHWL